MQPIQKRIFLSHATKDKPVAEKLADLLTNGCAVNPNEILCTSLEGKGIPTGASSFVEYLREQIQKPELVILLLSENFFASHFCMCELGAVWGMGLANFPLVIPPTERGKLKAVMVVAQAGDVTQVASLDELRDRVKQILNAGVPTSTWTVKRDSFLTGLSDVIKTLEKPLLVTAAELGAANEKYLAAMTEIGNKEKEVKSLYEQIGDLEKVKDRADVKAINQKYSTEQEQFDKLLEGARAALRKIKRATERAIFFEMREDRYHWDGADEWREVQEAEKMQEVEVIHDAGSYCAPNDEHPRVWNARNAVKEVSIFLSEPSHEKFAQKLENEYGFPLKVSNQEFWHEILKAYI